MSTCHDFLIRARPGGTAETGSRADGRDGGGVADQAPAGVGWRRRTGIEPARPSSSVASVLKTVRTTRYLPASVTSGDASPLMVGAVRLTRPASSLIAPGFGPDVGTRRGGNQPTWSARRPDPGVATQGGRGARRTSGPTPGRGQPCGPCSSRSGPPTATSHHPGLVGWWSGPCRHFGCHDRVPCEVRPSSAGRAALLTVPSGAPIRTGPTEVEGASQLSDARRAVSAEITQGEHPGRVAPSGVGRVTTIGSQGSSISADMVTDR